MKRLDPQELRNYVNRDWAAPERLARAERARAPVEEKVRLAVELYAAACEARPGWPDEATRTADFEAHLRLRALLDRAAHVGAR